MAARTLANLGLKAFFNFGEDGWNDEVDANFLKLSVLVQAGAIGIVATKPSSPADGDVYIINEAATSNPNTIAVFDGGVWKHFPPQHGWAIYNRADDSYIMWSGAAWVVLPLANLRAIGGLDGTSGVVEQSGPGAFVKRSVGVSSATSLLTRADGDTRYSTAEHTHPETGVTSFNTRTGAVTLTQADIHTALGRTQNELNNIDGIAALTPEATGVVEKTGDGAFTVRSVGLEGPLSLLTLAQADARFTSASSLLENIGALGVGTGLVEKIGSDTVALRTIGGINNEDILTRGTANGLYIAKDEFSVSQLSDVPDSHAGMPYNTIMLNAAADAWEYRGANSASSIRDYTANTTLVALDVGGLLRVAHASGAVVTIPSHTDLPLPIGTTLEVTQVMHGKVTFNPGSSVAFDFLAGKTHRTTGQNAVVKVTKTDLNTWLLSGDLDAAGAASFSVDNLMVTVDDDTITVDAV